MLIHSIQHGEHIIKCTFEQYGLKTASALFQGLEYLVYLDLSNLDTSKCTSFGGFLNYCLNLETLILGDKFDTHNATSFSMMFCNCRKLKSLDLSMFNTSKVTNMKRMFDYALELSSLNLSSFDLSNVTDVTKFFNSNSKIDLINFSNTSIDDTNLTYTNFFSGVNANCKLYIDCNYADVWERILVTNQSTSLFPTTATYGSDGINLCS